MSSPYVGEIRMFGGNFPPNGWMLCQGQILAIAENEVLFNLIGTTYGGDGQSTFALPNLSGRIPVHAGTGGGGTYVIGQLAGTETVTLTTQQIPNHSHVPQANTAGNQASAANGLYGGGVAAFAAGAPTLPMNPTMIQNAGGNQPHDNMMPYLCVTFIISLFGIFPTQG